MKENNSPYGCVVYCDNMPKGKLMLVTAEALAQFVTDGKVDLTQVAVVENIDTDDKPV